MKLTGFGRFLLFVVGLGIVAVGVLRFAPASTVDGWLAKLRGRSAPGASGTSSTPPAPTPGAANPHLPEGAVSTRLRLHGSNAIGKDLAPALAEAFLRAQGATSLERRPGRPDEVTVVGRLPGGAVAIEIAAHGSSTAFDDLGRGGADIGMASRRIKPDEARKLASLGDMTSAASEHVLGLDGVVVVVARSNPLDELTLDRLRDLFAGRVSDFAAVGGPAGPVHVHARDDRSGTFDTFQSLVLDGASLASTARRYEDNQQLAADVAADPNGIGFVGLAYVGAAKALKIREEGSLAYRPTVFTVRTEDYRLSRRLYLYTPASPREPWVREFVEFALGHDGQAIVDTLGFVGQSLLGNAGSEGGAETMHRDAPPEYVRVTRDATRLPLDFRFESGSDRLDNKARRDVGRLLESLATPERRNRRVLLLGFADSQGPEATNLRLSAGRAEAVAAELAAEGIRAEIATGFGSALPVATNATDDGRSRNRRVEVWLK